MALLCATAPWKILVLSSKGSQEGNQRLSSIYSPRIEAWGRGRVGGAVEVAKVTRQAWDQGEFCLCRLMLFILVGLGSPFLCSGEGVFSMLVSLGAWGRGQHVLPRLLVCSQLPNPCIGFLYFLETPRLPWAPVLMGTCLFYRVGRLVHVTA